MVKRVKDMSEKVSDVAGIDSKKVLKDVESIGTLVSIDTEETSDRDRGHTVIVPDKCPICEMGVKKGDIKYYDVAFLKKFMSVRGKVIPRSKSGVCAMHQRKLKQSIKRARYLALLPYVDVGV